MLRQKFPPLPRWIGLGMIGLLLFMVALPVQSSPRQQATPQLIESDAPMIAREGQWESQSVENASGGTYLFNQSDNAALQLDFTGPTIEILYGTGPELGTFAIEVDGSVLRTVITTNEQTAYQQRAVINYLTDEPHTLRIYAQGGGVVAIDAFVAVLPSATQNVENTFDPRVAPCQETDPYIASVTNSGIPGTGGPIYSSMSFDGRYIVFDYYAQPLSPIDTNSSTDIYLHDRQLCQTILVSHSANNQAANGFSSRPYISADGRYIAFHSSASNLVANDTNGFEDVFVYDRTTDQITRASVASDGTQGNGRSEIGSISDNGRYVAFQTRTTNFVANDTDPNTPKVFVHDVQTGQTTLVSIASDGQTVSFGSQPRISGNGRFVAFLSRSDNIVAGDTSLDVQDTFIRDLVLGQTTKVTLSTVGDQSNAGWYSSTENMVTPVLSTDGRFVAFMTPASNMVPNDTNDTMDVFIRDRQANTTILASATYADTPAGIYDWGLHYHLDMSRDGRYVVFGSQNTTVVMGDANGTHDLFRRDIVTRSTIRINLYESGGEQNTGNSFMPYISGDGRFVSFTSDSPLAPSSGTQTGTHVYIADLNNPDTLAIFRTDYAATSLIATLTDLPPLSAYNSFNLNAPQPGQFVMGDWNGDGLKTPGVYAANGVFYYTNGLGPTTTWSGFWIGLYGRPIVAGRFNASLPNDCAGAVDSGEFPPYGRAFALYFTCDFSGVPAPPLAFQWLSVLLPDNQGFTGTHQFVAGDWNGDGADSVAVRRGEYIAFTDVPPTTVYSAFDRAQYWGTPPTTGGNEGVFLAGNWNLDTLDSFGVLYSNGYFYRRDDLDWNSGRYTLQRVGQPIGFPITATSWRQQ